MEAPDSNSQELQVATISVTGFSIGDSGRTRPSLPP